MHKYMYIHVTNLFYAYSVLKLIKMEIKYNNILKAHKNNERAQSYLLIIPKYFF